MSDNKIETLLGAGIHTVTKKDGTSEAVSVRQLAIKEYPKYLEVMDDEPASILLWTGKPADWVETLAPESHAQLVEFGEAINEGFFTWFQRRRNRQERFLPGFVERLATAASKPR